MNTILSLLPVLLAFTASLLLWLRMSPKVNLNYRGHTAFYAVTAALPVQAMWGFATAMHLHLASGFTIVAATATLAQTVTAAVLLDIDVTKDRLFGLHYFIVATFAVYSLFAH